MQSKSLRDWNVLTGRMDNWTPPEEAFDPTGSWKLAYERHVLIPDHGGNPGGGQAGELVVEHLPNVRAVRVQETVVASATTVTTTGEFQCSDNQLLTPKNWNLDIRWASKMPQIPVAGLDQKRSGRVEGGEIVFVAAKERRRPAPQHWTISWLLFAVLPRLPFAADTRLDCDLFEEGELYKPDQKFAYAGEHLVELGGKKVTLHAFEQFGRGVLPTRWWLDSQHRIVLAASERCLYLLGSRAKGVAS